MPGPVQCSGTGSVDDTSRWRLFTVDSLANEFPSAADKPGENMLLSRDGPVPDSPGDIAFEPEWPTAVSGHGVQPASGQCSAEMVRVIMRRPLLAASCPLDLEVERPDAVFAKHHLRQAVGGVSESNLVFDS